MRGLQSIHDLWINIMMHDMRSLHIHIQQQLCVKECSTRWKHNIIFNSMQISEWFYVFPPQSLQPPQQRCEIPKRMVLCVPPTITATTSTKVWNPNNHRYEVPLDMVETKLCADAAGQCLHWASAHSHICSTTEQWQRLTSSQVFSLPFPLLARTPEGRNKKKLIPVYSCSYRIPHPTHLKPPKQGPQRDFTQS
jgi:hypothetical protein